jgi:Aminoglycoside-2''-adenylyltransferase
VTDDQLPLGGTEIGPDPLWDPWHPEHVTRLLAGVRVLWCVAGGWALDLGRGGQTRVHEDLEIAVPAGDATFDPVRWALAGHDIEAKHVRAKDEADLRGMLPLLEPAARDWLRWGLSLAHPGHTWIGLL